jgi:hypothetical protein
MQKPNYRLGVGREDVEARIISTARIISKNIKSLDNTFCSPDKECNCDPHDQCLPTCDNYRVDPEDENTKKSEQSISKNKSGHEMWTCIDHCKSNPECERFDRY